MKISKKKRRQYAVVETCGQVLFYAGFAVMLFCNWIEAPVGVYVSGGIWLLGLVLWILGGNLRVNLYICPVCKRKLLIKEGWGVRRSIVKELPQTCPCGWRVQFEEE